MARATAMVMVMAMSMMMMLMMTVTVRMEIMMLDGPNCQNVPQSLAMTIPKPKF